MRHVVIVGNQTLSEPRLLETVKGLAAEEPTTFEVVVPVTPLTDQEEALRHSEHVANPLGESGAVTLARHRLRAALQQLHDLGLQATGDIGDPHPVKALVGPMAAQPVAAVVVSTLPKRRSRWLSADLPAKVQRKFDVRVIHIEAAAPPPRSGRRHVAAQQITPYHHTSHR
jgi:hypothetical protein